jgi:hypothetical protein
MLQQPMRFLNEADFWFHFFLSDNEFAWSNCAGACPSNTISHFLSTTSAGQINTSVTLFKEICSVTTTGKQNLQKTKLNKARHKSIFWVFTSGRHDTTIPIISNTPVYLQSTPDKMPLFVRRNLWRYIEGSDWHVLKLGISVHRRSWPCEEPYDLNYPTKYYSGDQTQEMGEACGMYGRYEGCI